MPDIGENFGLCSTACWVRAPFSGQWPSSLPMLLLGGHGHSADLITRKDHCCKEWMGK